MAVSARASRFLHDPLSIFLIAGALVFAAYAIVDAGRSDPVRYTPAIEAALVDDFEALAGRPATDEDRARLQRDYITDELMFREAIERGLYLTDGQVKSRMIDKVRYLIAGAPNEPDEEAMVDFYAENLDLYRSEPTTSFEQVYFSQRPENGAQLLAALKAGEEVAGEDLWTGPAYPNYGDSMVRGIFGQPFLGRLQELPTNEWAGPVKSLRGWHFVRKTGEGEPELMPYAQVRSQVRQDLMMAETRAAIGSAVGELEEKFDVEVDA